MKRKEIQIEKFCGPSKANSKKKKKNSETNEISRRLIANHIIDRREHNCVFRDLGTETN